MKKIGLLLFFILSLSMGVCYGEDIYVGQAHDNHGEYAAYLRTGSIHGTYKITSGDPISVMTYYHSLVLIPTDETLRKLRDLMLDNRIAYQIAEYKFVGYRDRIDNPSAPEMHFYFITRHLISADGECLYTLDNSRDIPLNNISKATMPAEAQAFELTAKYVDSHPDVITTNPSD